MELTVKGKHLDVGDALREHVKEQLTHTAQKYFRNPIEATVIFSKERKNNLFRADISIHIGGGIVLQANHEANDPYPAFDVAAKLIAKRLSRYKDKLRDHHKHEKTAELLAATYTTLKTEDNEAEGGNEPVVIAEMEMQVQTLAVADAVMRLELGDMPALMFRNPKHSGLNMVYRRKDGNIGWVDPVGAKKAEPVKKTVAIKKAGGVKKK
ncbi:MAG: ribosome-associated translation inhibitor RaiA [Alphaproteobacteria bacterium]|nr:ribosome-associated translation inhibitor RaiA [Alphaproteobacteria bacterium]